MADKNKIIEWVRIPAYIVGAIIAIGVLLGALGFGFNTPGSRWNMHDVKHVVEAEVLTKQFAKIDTALVQLSDGMMEQQTLFEAVIIGDCIDRSKQQLELQRLIPTCKNLGIDKD